MRKTPPKTFCWLLSFLLLFEWSGVIGWPPTGETAQPVSLTLPSAAELAKAGAFTPQMPQRSQLKPDDLVARTEALVRSVPRVRYDLSVRAQALGPGVDPAFRFVRDQIRFEAYPGVLRGAEGTYVTRVGNAFDRSLLLSDLLKRKGLKNRFAMGKLPRPQAERLFTRIFEPAPQLEADAVSKAPAAGQPEAEAFMTRLRARAVRDYAAIRKALGDTLPSKAGPSRDEVLREIEQHVWVQAEVNGRWVDLDSAFPDATPGRTYTSAERTSETLPKETYQRVTIRVVSEMLTGSSLKSETALEFSATAEELLDRQIFLTHTPGGGGGGLAGAISGAAMGPDAWTPMLWVDGATHLGKPVVFSEQSKPAERGRPPGGGLGGLFGAGGALSASSQFVAEWLEFEIAFPDGRRDVTRRALVDRAGMAWRQAGNLDPAKLRPLPRDAEGLMAPRALHNIWFSAGRHNLADYAGALEYLTQLVNTGAYQTPRPDISFGEQVWPLAMMNFAFLIQSDHATLPAINDSPSHRFYADSPRILIVSVGHDARTGDGYIQYDLRRDHLRGLAREASGEVGVVERKIWFGVLQGALEHETVVQYALAGGGNESAIRSTSSLLTGEGAIALRPATSGTQLPADRETAARMAHALANSAILVVPRPVLRGGLSGWWEIAANGADTRAVLAEDLNVARGPLGFPKATGNPPVVRPGWKPPWPKGTIPQDPLPGGGARPPGPPTTGPATAKPLPNWDPGGPMSPGGKNKDECKKKGSALPTGGVRVAMASSPSSDSTSSQGSESVQLRLLLAQTSTEYSVVTGCVAKPAVGAVATLIPFWELAVYGVALAVLGYVIGSSL